MAQKVAKGRVAMDLKLSILSALNKLADRDTQQIATEELTRIAEGLPPEGISVYLGCIFEISSEQKSVVRREGVRLLGILATLYGELLTPHLQKIVSSILKRLKEPDSNIRDTCVDTVGTLVAHVPTPSYLANAVGGTAEQVALSGPFGVFTKPLFDVMNEQARNAQIGAAMCFSRAMENATDMPPACTARLCSKLLKFLNSPSFIAKPALLPALGGLSRASGGGINQHLGAIITCLQESLRSSDWATRKAAADTFASVALSVGGPPLTNFKQTTMSLLDSYRFDKVKPTRDSVVDAIHIWKNVPDPPVVEASPTRTVSSKSNESNSTLKAGSTRRYLTADSKLSSPKVSQTSNVVPDKGSVKKALPERKTNLDFFRKLSIRNSDDWQIEVAIPRGSPPNIHNKENHEENIVKSAPLENTHRAVSNEANEEKEKKRPEDDSKFEPAENKIKQEINVKQPVKQNGWSTNHHHNQEDDETSVNSSNEQQSFVAIGRQLSQLEKGQSNLMEMLQEFMGNSHENTMSLESRVQRLERVVEDMARLTAASIRTGHVDGVDESTEMHRSNGSHNVFRTPRMPNLRPHYDNSDRAGFGRLGEGPSARSVWRASKDEATLAAIRDAGYIPNSEVILPRSMETSVVKHPDRNSDTWSVWSRVVESLHTGDLDTAYEEVICSGDELLMVRLMNRTGPVLEQLSNDTISELITCISRFLQQPSFVDCALPWIRQVSELVKAKGPKCLGLSGEVKKEFISCLHEAATLDFPEKWMGAAISKMANQLGALWTEN